jgi:hypothetical protein
MREKLGSGLRFSSMVAPLTESADLLKVQAPWPPFDVTQGGEQASNHDRRGLLLGRNLVNIPD